MAKLQRNKFCNVNELCARSSFMIKGRSSITSANPAKETKLSCQRLVAGHITWISIKFQCKTEHSPGLKPRKTIRNDLIRVPWRLERHGSHSASVLHGVDYALDADCTILRIAEKMIVLCAVQLFLRLRQRANRLLRRHWEPCWYVRLEAPLKLETEACSVYARRHHQAVNAINREMQAKHHYWRISFVCAHGCAFSWFQYNRGS